MIILSIYQMWHSPETVVGALELSPNHAEIELFHVKFLKEAHYPAISAALEFILESHRFLVSYYYKAMIIIG